MKNVVVLKMENVMVKDLNVQEYYAKLEQKGKQELSKKLGLDVLECEMGKRMMLEKLRMECTKKKEKLERAGKKKDREILEKKEKKIKELEKSLDGGVWVKEEMEERVEKKREEIRKVWEEEEWQKKIMKGVDEKRAEFYKSEFGKKLKDGWNEVFGVLRMLEEKKGVAVFVVSKHMKFKEVLRRLGCGEMEMVDFRGDWLEEILRLTGRERKDVVLSSNEKEDWERREEWGIKVEGFSVEKEGRTGFLGKLGLLVKDKENQRGMPR